MSDWLQSFNTERLKAGLKKYGRTGVYTYLGLSTMVTTGFYIAIERNVDVKKIMGIKDEPESAEPPGLLQRLLLGPGSHLALAVLCSKACIPVKLPVAAALTPYVYRQEHRLLQRLRVHDQQAGQQRGGAARDRGVEQQRGLKMAQSKTCYRRPSLGAAAAG